MNWRVLDNGSPLGTPDPSGGQAPRRKEWILSAALGAASLASSVFGGITSAKAAEEQKRQLRNEQAKNDAWYRRKQNESYTDTAAGQNMIRIARDFNKQNWKRAQGAAAIGGGTDAETAQAKEAGNRMMGDAIANMAAQDTARKDNAEESYRQRAASISQQQMAAEQQKANAIAQVAGAASDAFAQGALATMGTGSTSNQPQGDKGSPGGGGLQPASKTNPVSRLRTNQSNYKVLNPYIRQMQRLSPTPMQIVQMKVNRIPNT